jgi:hypothetical protein
MERIQMLLQKITDLHRGDKEKTIIDIDLMLDYTRVLYADLLDWRGKMQEMPLLTADHRPEPTQSEITAAIEQAHTEVAATNVMTAPSIELGQNVQHFEESENDHNDHKEQQTYTLSGMNPSAAKRAQDEFHRMIGINDKYQFISELFSNNKESYETVIEEMNEFDNYQQAEEWLKLHIAGNFGWDDESYTVQSFYSLLERFFRGK